MDCFVPCVYWSVYLSIQIVYDEFFALVMLCYNILVPDFLLGARALPPGSSERE